MIQTDWIWTLGIGASFAAAAKEQLKSEIKAASADNYKWYTSGYFVYALLFLSLVFIPSGIYNFQNGADWESMFYMSRDMPPLIPALFIMITTLSGIGGYWLAYRCIRAGREKTAHLVWMLGWSLFFLLYLVFADRAFYAGTFADWNGPTAGWYASNPTPVKAYSLADWFSSSVFYALFCQGIVFVPAFGIPIILWMWKGRKK